LYIGTSTGSQRFQKYIASGTTAQYLRGDGTLATFPSLTGFVPYTGATANVDLGTHTILAQNATISSSGSGNTATITHSSGSGIGLNITKGGNGEGLYINKTSGSGNAATIIGTLNATTLVKSGGTSTQYLMADGSVSTLTNPITGTGTSGQVAYFTGATTQGGSNNLFWDNTNGRLGIGTNTPSANLDIYNLTSAITTIANGVVPDGTKVGGILNLMLGGRGATGNYVFANDILGKVSFYGYGNNFVYEGAVIQSVVTTGGNVDRASHIVALDFYTKNSGQNVPTFNMRLTGTGNLLLGSTTDSGEKLQVTGTMKVTGATTIGGNLIVDTNTLFVDATNNRVGIGTASPTLPLTVYNPTANTNAVEIRGGGGSSQSRLLFTYGSDTTKTDDNALILTNTSAFLISVAGSRSIILNTNSLDRATLDSSGNLGLGVTPSAWGGTIAGKALQIYDASFWSVNLTGYASVGANYYYDNSYRYIKAAQATDYYQYQGQHVWRTAISGTVGAAISFTQAMTLDASGNLAVGTTTTTNRLEVWGSGNTAARIVGQSAGNATLILSSGGVTAYSIKSGNGDSSLRIDQDGSERIMLASGGNLLIGSTTNTGEKLQVTGTAKVSGLITITGVSEYLRNIQTGTSAQAQTWYASDGTTRRAVFGFRSGGSDNFTLLNERNGSLLIGTNDATNLTIASNGAATFSSSVTAASLVSNGQVSLFDYVNVQNNFPNFTQLSGIRGRAYYQTNYPASILFGDPTASNNNIITFNVSNTDTTGTEKMRLNGLGRLLIGSTTDSGELLQVNGTAKITGVTTINANLNVITANPNVVARDNGTGYAVFVAIGQNATGAILDSGVQGSIAGSLMTNAPVNSGIIGTRGSHELHFGTNGTSRMYLTTGGNLAVDTNTLFVDATNNRVGIGTATPSYGLHVQGTGYFNDNVRFPNQKGLLFVQTGGTLLGSISMDSGNAVSIDNNGFIGLSVGSNYNLLGGNTGIGTNTFGTSATRTFAVLNGTAPSSSPADTFQMYSNDISAGNAAPHFRTENGAVIKLYQQDNGVAAANYVSGIGSAVTTLDAFDGYTIGQVVKALRNAGILS
jgi:hypothetical protein